MKTFHMMADCTFEADDVVDAFAKLALHFLVLSQGSEKYRAAVGKYSILTAGSIGIEPVE